VDESRGQKVADVVTQVVSVLQFASDNTNEESGEGQKGIDA
jgi:hypothetical protein